MRIAFCAFGVDEGTIRRSEFYRQDYEVLRSLGHEVTAQRSPTGIGSGIDLGFVWWWNYLWMWGPIARLERIPTLITGVFDLEAFPRLSSPKRWLKKWGTRFGDLHVFISQEEFEKVPSATHIRPESARYSPLVIDVSNYKPKSGLARSKGPFTVANVCWQRRTNLERKMVFELLEAFSRFSREITDARLILAGPPEDGASVLKERARTLGVADRVEFPGEMSRDAKIELFQECSLYVQVSRYEGFGLATAEALACGAPVLVSRVGAVPEVIGDCGSYVDSLDVDGILKGIRQVYRDYDGALGRAEAGVHRVQTLFTVERRREDLGRYIEEVMSRRGGKMTGLA